MTETITAIAVRNSASGHIWIGGSVHVDLFDRARGELGPVMLNRLIPGFMTSRLRFVGYDEAIRLDPQIKYRLTPPSANLAITGDPMRVTIDLIDAPSLISAGATEGYVRRLKAGRKLAPIYVKRIYNSERLQLVDGTNRLAASRRCGKRDVEVEVL